MSSILKKNKSTQSIDYITIDFTMDYAYGFPIKKKEKKCECGATKVYGKDCRVHSDWCPLYEEYDK